MLSLDDEDMDGINRRSNEDFEDQKEKEENKENFNN